MLSGGSLSREETSEALLEGGGEGSGRNAAGSDGDLEATLNGGDERMELRSLIAKVSRGRNGTGRRVFHLWHAPQVLIQSDRTSSKLVWAAGSGGW